MSTLQSATGGGRKKWVAGNWKMFLSPQTAQELAHAMVEGVTDLPDRVGVIVCPPFPFLGLVAETITGSPVALGAQNCFCELEGAFTGEVSPRMLHAMGCEYVILGHSERRHSLGETDAFISKKVCCSVEAGLRVILCFGETLPEREANQTEQVLDRQFHGSLAGLPRDKVSQLVFAYEPVWAIGTGRHATLEPAQLAHAFLRRRTAEVFGDETAGMLLILYGGGVNPENAASLFGQSEVDGCLLGGASLKAKGFLDIVKAAVSTS